MTSLRLILLRVALLAAVLAALPAPLLLAADAPFRVLAFYSTNVEKDHVLFARQAIQFFTDRAAEDGYTFAATLNWDDLNDNRLKSVDLVLWLDDFPHTAAQRSAFERYMTRGGGWLGFHIAAYNDADTHWPWFVRFLGGAVFYGNNWPPLPATLTVDDPSSPVTRHLPASFISPINEWYSWKPSPRLDPKIKVLITLAPSNFPLGLKDTIVSGDVPVVWTNTRYRMLYLNMGHGDHIFDDPRQNRFFRDALAWIGRPPRKPAP